MKTWLKSLNKLKTVTRKYVIIKKTVTKTFTKNNLLTRELVPIYIEQVIGDPLRTEASFTAPKVGLESPHSSTFCAGHNTKASPNSKDVRPRDCATHEIQNRKDQKTKDKDPKEKDTFGAKFLGYRRYPEGRFFWGCQTLPLEDFFLLRFQTSPSMTARLGALDTDSEKNAADHSRLKTALTWRIPNNTGRERSHLEFKTSHKCRWASR